MPLFLLQGLDHILIGKTGLSDEVAEDIIRACTPHERWKLQNGTDEEDMIQDENSL